MSAPGHTLWAVPGGRIPFPSAGPEPAFTGFDALSILNAGDEDARLEIVVYFPDREPVGPFRLDVPARRVRHVRVNDLVDPRPIPLDADYAALVRSDVPVVVQFSRQDTRPGEKAIATTMAFPL